MQDDSGSSVQGSKIPESALGPYGDVPVAYAVFRVAYDPEADDVTDVVFVHVNQLYCKWSGHDRESLVGHSLAEIDGNARELWFPHCYRSAVLGEKAYGEVFNPTWDHWVSFNAAPASVEGCCTFAFSLADEERREHDEIVTSRDTSDIIIGITEMLSRELDYENAIYGLLEMISDILHPDRLIIIERGPETSSCTFELCAEGVPSRIEFIQNIPNERFDSMGVLMSNPTSQVVTSEVENLKRVSDGMYRQMSQGGVERMMGVQLQYNGRPIGYLSANNYQLEEGIDAKRVLDTVAPFVSARIANQRFIEELEYASTHDALTGTLNRHGLDLTIGERITAQPDEPYVLALVDVDDFKAVNDTYGHSMGDMALQTLSDTLGRMFPDNAIVGRNGGDEFLAMLFGEQVEKADEALAAFSETDLSFSRDGMSCSLTVSIGYTVFPEQAKNLRDAYVKADAAMYAAKRAGKHGVHKFTE